MDGLSKMLTDLDVKGLVDGCLISDGAEGLMMDELSVTSYE